MYIEKCFRKLKNKKDVSNILIFNENGIPKKSTMNRMESIRNIGQFENLINKAKQIISIQNEENVNDFVNIRLKTKKFELIIAKDDDLYVAVTQSAIGKSSIADHKKRKLLNIFFFS